MDNNYSQPPPLPPQTPIYASAPPLPPRREGSFRSAFFQNCLAAGCATILAPVILVGGLLLIGVYIASESFDETVENPLSHFSGTGENALTRQILRRGDPEAGAIAVVTIHGAISGTGSPLTGDGTMKFIADQLRQAGDDDEVKAVILQIDSPGGGLTASDELHNEVRKLRKTGKPVIAWAGGMMASGGYYIAVGAEQIMASPTATVGSIGVILQHFQVQELLNTLGVTVDPITSGAHKDLASPFREMTEEERKLLQDYIDLSHKRFVDIVAEGRNMAQDEVAKIADGSIMGAEAALEKGLIDSIGHIDDAVALLETETGESDMKIIGYTRALSFSDVFSDVGSSAAEGALKALRAEITTNNTTR